VPDLAALTAGDFAVALDGYFTVVGPESSQQQIRLVQVVQLASPLPGRRAPFSLRFRGPAGPALAQGIHHLVHADLGELEIFIVPIAADQQSRTYEAVFA
jgi:hypothetical protein